MAPFIHSDSPNNEEAIYSLYGVVIHIGPNYRSGHFVAKVKNLKSSSDLWQLFDDKEVSRMSLEDVKHSAAYILFMRGKRHWKRKRGINNYSFNIYCINCI
uniref:USP domain-containing protein n=1 Tax=Meloidogyne enterolobii TaxID=390850 RepID=A0A6V7VI05_MELEN|nr:unnamed protein product [Meloidogyne enterolobii]